MRTEKIIDLTGQILSLFGLLMTLLCMHTILLVFSGYSSSSTMFSLFSMDSF